jgi:1-acyl-sn-glycerol-3-phosphate acyltransferase
VAQLLLKFPGRTVLSVWAWFALGVIIIVMLPVVAAVFLATAPFDKGRYWAGYTFRKVGVLHQLANPLWKFEVSGTIPPDPRRPYMVVANHESFVDILLISHLPFEMKWLSKSEFFKYPLVGWMMRMAGDIKLDRADRKSAIKVLGEMRDRLDKKVSVMVFPEGTRSQSGELGDFFDGAFRVAIQAGVPVLPLAVLGTRDALIKRDWRVGSSHAEVRVLDPIPTDGMTKRDTAALRDRARTAIAEALDEMRAERSRSV